MFIGSRINVCYFLRSQYSSSSYLKSPLKIYVAHGGSFKQFVFVYFCIFDVVDSTEVSI